MNKFAFVHIPKTGGTTIVNMMKENHSVCHYDKNKQPNNPQSYDIFFGHFYPKTYNDLPLVTWLRNPVDRMISHYQHLKERQEKGNNGIMVYPAKIMKFDPTIDIISFAETVGNLYPIYTENNLKQFTYFGILEFMHHSIKLLKEKFKLCISENIIHERRSTNKITLGIYEHQKLKKLLKDDTEIYIKALSRFI